MRGAPTPPNIRGTGTTHPLQHGGFLPVQDGSQHGHQPQRVPPVGVLRGHNDRVSGHASPSPVLGPLPTANSTEQPWGFHDAKSGTDNNSLLF